jgi:hypothetical protein
MIRTCDLAVISSFPGWYELLGKNREKIRKKWARQDIRASVKPGHPSLYHLLLHMDQAMAGYDPFSP